MPSQEENAQKEKKKRFGFRARAAIICVLVAGGVLAARVISERKLAFSRFHIGSNYLEEGGSASYTVADWGGGFDILLYNHEEEDIAQLATVDMTYQVTAEHAAVSVKKQNGEAVAEAADGGYIFGTEAAAAYHVLHVTPDAGAGQNDAITVTVRTTSPYQKTISAKFQIQPYRIPDYTVTDQNDGTVLITLHTNDYQDTMTVEWDPGKYSPDRTNEQMAAWSDETHIEYFPVDCNSTYELLFYKKTDDPYTERKGTATEIALD